MTHRSIIVRGTLDASCPLTVLRGQRDVLRKICGYVDAWYAAHVDRSPIGHLRAADLHYPVHMSVTFPPPSGIDINMMPINLYHLRATVPDAYRAYIPIITSCKYTTMPPSRHGDEWIAYLTIHESEVEAGHAQRRPGLHIERPTVRNGRTVSSTSTGHDKQMFYSLDWGRGRGGALYPIEGIYVASTVAHSTAVYPCLITRPEEVTESGGGSIELLRPYVGAPVLLDANELCWFTDRTPHESLPLAASGVRQFFRLVMGPIGVWYTQHNTPNPLGVQPNAALSHANKFETGV